MAVVNDPRRLAILVTVFSAGLSACDPAVGDAPGCEGGDSGAAAVPIAVDCSFSFAGVQQHVTYEVSTERTDIAAGGKLIASGMLDDSEYEGRTFSMTIYAEDGTVGATTLYQMDRTRLPVNEFQGQHGFTGLNWVKDPDAQENLQFACFARDPADPPTAWDD